jgi:hypothetical protein
MGLSSIGLTTAAKGDSPYPRVAGLPDDAKELINQFEAESSRLRAEAERQIAAKLAALAKSLKNLQDSYARSDKLDEAVAIRDAIRAMTTPGAYGYATWSVEQPITSRPGAVMGHIDGKVMPAAMIEPDPGDLTAYHTRLGERFYFTVVGASEGALWGTDVYTHDSRLAKAAVHAGVASVGEEAHVQVTILKGPWWFHGSTRHGVTSSDWNNQGGYYAGYLVERIPPYVAVAKVRPALPAPGPMPAYRPGNRAAVGQSTFVPLTGSVEGIVWGTDVYTDDSSLAAAAVHAGVLRPGETGMVKVTTLPGQPSYRGSTRNGVTSSDYGSWSGSIRIERDNRRSALPGASGAVATSQPAQWIDVSDEINLFARPATSILELRKLMESQGVFRDGRREEAEKLLDSLARRFAEYETLNIAFGKSHPNITELRSQIVEVAVSLMKLSGIEGSLAERDR